MNGRSRKSDLRAPPLQVTDHHQIVERAEVAHYEHGAQNPRALALLQTLCALGGTQRNIQGREGQARQQSSCPLSVLKQRIYVGQGQGNRDRRKLALLPFPRFWSSSIITDQMRERRENRRRGTTPMLLVA